MNTISRIFGSFRNKWFALVCCLSVAIGLTTASLSAAIPPPPGGPILIIADPSDKFGEFYQEILLNEGLNAFDVKAIGNVSAATLANYDIVILATMTLTSGPSGQVAILSDWVNAGGNLIAMRPDKQLASLLGLADAGASLSNGYLLIDTLKAPGSGLVGETIQFHGTADRYTLVPSGGAESLATLYTNATTATANPAVTLRAVGANGGQAAAFTYDLARSIVYTRQGNPAWAAQERDGFSPIRSDDKFYGNAVGDPQSDWVDLNKVAIPQADEHQRLLANLILKMNLAKKPLPRFWYFPRGEKAVVLMTGDDHANNGTEVRFNRFKQLSPVNCSVEDWECVRGTSYIYSGTPIADATVAAFNADGFEVSLHINTNCGDFTPASLRSFYTAQVAQFASQWPSIPAPLTQRHHCIAWSDWVTGAIVQLENNIRLDTSYYYWPPSWVQNRPGFFNGSGMPMRFADLDGTRIDVFLSETQMTDESGQSYPFTIDTLLNRALGPEGYYGVFTANAHTDFNQPDGTYYMSEAIVASAAARGVPVVTARQLLTWLDGRNASAFSSLAWDGTTLSFNIAPIANARGLQSMLPMRSVDGGLAELRRNGSPIPYTTESIKGVEYALFPANAGTYQATYAADNTPPEVTSTAPADGASEVSIGVQVTSAFSEAIAPQTINASTVILRNSAGAVVPAAISYDSGNKTVQLRPNSPLAVASTYSGLIKGGANGVKDLAGNALAVDKVWTFTTVAQVSAPCQLQQPCSIWPGAPTPGAPSVNDPNAVELGVKFQSDIAGFITGIRFYKGSGNSGIHIGSLWSISGSLLAQATFSNETASGWQQVNFATPVAIAANTVYVASYHAPSGNYAGDNNFFAVAGVDTEPLHALRDGVSGGNGVYAYSGSSTFPANTYASSNYWVDIVFTTSAGGGADTTPPTVTATAPVNGATGVGLAAVVTATFSEAMNAATISTGTFELTQGGTPVSATVSYDGATGTASLVPNTALTGGMTYAARVRGGSSGVKDDAGNALTADVTWSFTTVTADTTPPYVASRSPANGAIGVPVGDALTVIFSEAMNASTINTDTVQLRNPSDQLVPATVGYNPGTLTATLTPSALLATSTTYTATVVGGASGVKDAAGNALAADATWTFTTASTACPCTIWSASTVPTIIEDSDTAAVELGVKFRANIDGFISGIRFYKAPNNTGTHVGTLWTSGGQQLARATFINETGSGWQQVNFATPVAITANTVYVASYHTNVGRYSANSNYFGAGVDNGPLRALQNGESGSNGVYAYGPSPAFPTSSYQASNYWVDVVFAIATGPDTAPPTVASKTPVDGATNVSLGIDVTVAFSEAMNAATINTNTVQLRDPSNQLVPATVSYDGSSRTAKLNPSNLLAPNTTYTATVVGGGGGAKDIAGNALAGNVTWSFTTGAEQSAVTAENELLGSPASEWDISGAGDPSIQGFATDISYNRGETAQFKVNVAGGAAARLRIYRMGYYGGSGARFIDEIPFAGSSQPGCSSEGSTGLVDCGNWSVSASWPVPPDAVSGIYFAKAIRDDTGGASHIVFVVRDDASTSDILFQTSDTTWQAYNQYGGNSLYTGGPGSNPNRAYKVSYNRPFTTRSDVPEGHDWLMYAEYPMVRWLERNGYDVAYTTGVDTHRGGNLIRNQLPATKLFLSVGHDEYWSAEQRANVEAARDVGVHLAFFSGNEVYWKVRWEPSIAGPVTGNRTLVSYKESHNYPQQQDPSNIWTGLWRDTRPTPSEAIDANYPENALTGTIFTVNETPEVSLRVPSEYAGLRFWRNTAVAALTSGQTATLGEQIIGYEFDEDLDNGSRPAGLIRLSETFYPGAPRIQDETGSNYASQDVYHHSTLYRSASGALVFGAGTVQWSWGLDGTHDGPATPESRDMQQATINLFADMGIQPQTLQSTLLPAAASTDTTAPTSAIIAPTNGSSFQVGTPITIRGTTTEAGGGTVAAVEVSVNGGSAWFPAVGRTTWSYTWTPLSVGNITIKARAADDSGNLEAPGAAVSVTVGSSDTTAPTVTTRSPLSGASGVSRDTPVTVTFSEAMNAATINTSTVQLRDPAMDLVPATVSYNATTRTATLSPTQPPTPPLAASTAYTVTVVGGTSGVKDAAGNALAAPETWTFTTTAVAPVDVTLNSVGSQDGYVRESTETSNLGGANSATLATNRALRVGDDTSNRQHKAVVSFDTSGIPDGATIQSATLRLRRGTVTGANPFSSLGTCWVDVVNGAFGGNPALANGDFQAAATAVGVAQMTNAPANNDWSEAVLNGIGLAAINKTGTTQMRVYFQSDDDDDRAADEIGYFSGENSNAANRPQLVIRY